MKKCVLFLICCLLILSSVGCAKSSTTAPEYAGYDADSPRKMLDSQTVAEDSKYELYWDSFTCCVQLKEKGTDRIWASTPADYAGTSVNVQSPINIEVYKTADLKMTDFNGYTGVIEKQDISCELLEDKSGVRVTYYFGDAEISVPVLYQLKNSALDVTVDVKNIGEGDSHKLMTVSVAPFMCSASWTEEEETEVAVEGEAEDEETEEVAPTKEKNYLVVPSGSGALIYSEKKIDGNHKYTGNVYGTDLSRIFPEVLNDHEAIRMPVFGAKDGDRAVLCVLKDGAESAIITAETGKGTVGYANAFATFQIRGYDRFASDTSNSRLFGSVYDIASAARTEINPVLTFYPLTGEDANYNGMAKCYRNYLEETGALVETNATNMTYGLTILGGAQATTSIAGFPHDTTLVATTFPQAQEILKDLAGITGSTPAVRLLGYGDRGVNPGKLASGYGFSSIYGSDAERKNLETYCADNGLSIFSDFDLIRFNIGSSQVAKTATLRQAENEPFGTPIRDQQKNLAYYLLSRKQLLPSAQKLLAAADKKGVSGVSFMTLGHLTYSDYTDIKYAVKGSTQTEVAALIKSFTDKNHAVAAGPNAYAAAASTIVFDAPTDHGGNFALDAEIPFYEMVFRGTKPVFGEAVNLAADRDRAVLKSVAYGANLSFSVLYQYHTDFSETDVVYPELGAGKLYACDYNSNEQFIRDTLAKYGDLYAKINGAKMIAFNCLEDNVTETVYDNGVTVYVNHNKDKAVETPVGTLAGFEVKY